MNSDLLEKILVVFHAKKITWDISPQTSVEQLHRSFLPKLLRTWLPKVFHAMTTNHFSFWPVVVVVIVVLINMLTNINLS